MPFAFFCSISLHLQLIVNSPEERKDEGGEEEEEARPWHYLIPSRPTSCMGRDPEPSQPCLRRTVTPSSSPVQIQHLDA